MDHRVLKPFPKDFLFGASTSAYQVEGAAHEDGKTPSVQDTAPLPAGTSGWDVAADFYHRYREDVALMAKMGLREFRFSIAWTRILPNGDGAVNEAGVAFYSDLIDTLRAHNIEPVVTLYHFDLPDVLQKRYGGWSSRQCIEDFVAFTKVCFARFGSRVKYWLTINEQNMMVLYSSAGISRDMKEKYQQNHHMLLAQAKSMALCHKMCPGAWIAPAPNIVAVYPASSSPEDYLAAMDYDQVRNREYLDTCVFGRYPEAFSVYLQQRGWFPDVQAGDFETLAAAKPDFIAFNYYGGTTVRYISEEEGERLKADAANESELANFMSGLMTEPGLSLAVKNPLQKQTAYGMGMDPTGLRTTLRQLWERYRLPLLITENGCGVQDTLTPDGRIHDDYRIDYLAQHLLACRQAITDGVDLMGYSPWSAIDLISTHQGITKRYGFIYVDRDEFDLKDLARLPKDSYYWYKKVIATNGEDLSPAFTIEG